MVVAAVMWWCRFCLNSFSSHWWVDFGMGFVNGGGGGLLGSCLWLKFCGFFVFFFFSGGCSSGWQCWYILMGFVVVVGNGDC